MALKVTNILYQLAIWHQSVGKQCSLFVFVFLIFQFFFFRFHIYPLTLISKLQVIQ